MSLRGKLKDLFIPHSENGFKPNFLERFSASIMLLLVLLTFAIANLQALLWISSDWMVSSILPAVIVDLTNKERGTESLGTLRRNATLDRAAQMKAEDMAKNEYFAHYSPTGVSPWYWFDEVSYTFVHAGENLAVHFTDSDVVVKAWMDSPSHRANIMNNSFTEIGIGTAKGTYKGTPTIFVVQLFGTPAVAAPKTAAVATIAEAAESPARQPVTIEKVTQNDEATTAPQVAPATIKTAPSATSSNIESSEKTEVSPVVPEPVTVVQIEEVVPQTVEEDPAAPAPAILTSDLATTSRAGIPAPVVATGDTSSGSTPIIGAFERSATQPGLWLQFIYGLLASVVAVALILSIVIEWRKQHPVQIAYATGLLALMAILFQFHTVLTGGVSII